VNFALHRDAVPASKLANILRFQHNKGKNWGPKSRAKGGGGPKEWKLAKNKDQKMEEEKWFCYCFICYEIINFIFILINENYIKNNKNIFKMWYLRKVFLGEFFWRKNAIYSFDGWPANLRCGKNVQKWN
jgi:hypothetical protein